MKRKTPGWLSKAVFYEIYPPSFCDGNGDGIGDLPGILAKLDYIQSLGCNALWINSCWESPFCDGGYDVSDFYKVAPRYGTNADMEKLFAACHKRGMRVILDLVAGHTSVEHPWFKASAQARRNKYTNWYIWTDSVWDGAGCDGMESIRGFGDRDGSYISNYFAFQPALNYGFAKPDPAKPWQLPVSHPDVQALHRELRRLMKYWLDRGADGFRVDMASTLIKRDEGFKAVSRFWRGVRQWFDREFPEAALVAEWSNPEAAIKAGFHNDFLIHFGTEAYTKLFRAESSRDVVLRKRDGHSFFSREGRGNIREFLDVYLKHYHATRHLGFISLPSGNHDIGRLSHDRSEEDMKVAWTFLLTMPGIPYIYYGDEIGMRYLKNLSKEGGYGRTGARTPMQWDNTINAGFSTASPDKLYLPIDPAKSRPTVAAQEARGDSLLQFVRGLIRLRTENTALHGEGDFIPLYAEAEKYPLVYLRRNCSQAILVALNPTGREMEAEFRTRQFKCVGRTLCGHASITNRKGAFRIRIPSVGYAVMDVS